MITRIKWSILFFCCVCHFFLIAEYEHLPPAVLHQISPYLIPSDHPVKKKLDKIFSQSRVLLNLQTLKEAGFIHPKPRKYTKLIVTKHPELPGYIIKTYVDAQRYYKNQPEHHFWILRIQGAEAIRSLINQYNFHHLFKVPQKWIYVLPTKPSSSSEYYRKHCLLIEEDMHILNHTDNAVKWESRDVTEELLDNLYFILEYLGLKDCAKPDNIPFARDGKIAFIDTQTHHEWPVRYEKLSPYLSSSMKSYWKKRTSDKKK